MRIQNRPKNVTNRSNLFLLLCQYPNAPNATIFMRAYKERELVVLFLLCEQENTSNRNRIVKNIAKAAKTFVS